MDEDQPPPSPHRPAEAKPEPPPPMLDYYQPVAPRKRWRYVLSAFVGFVIILVAGGIGTFASLDLNNGIPLYITGGIIVAAAVIMGSTMKRSGWLIGMLLGAVVLGLLIGACGMIYPLQF